MKIHRSPLIMCQDYIIDRFSKITFTYCKQDPNVIKCVKFSYTLFNEMGGTNQKRKFIFKRLGPVNRKVPSV